MGGGAPLARTRRLGGEERPELAAEAERPGRLAVGSPSELPEERGSRMNERTMIHHVRRVFHPGFGELLGADPMKETERLRAEQPDFPSSAVLGHLRGASPASITRLVRHPPGVEAPIALVAGRHSECDLVRIPGASLRHALILLWPPTGEGELPFAEVIDLGTQTGIALPDGRLAARLASSEPIRVGVGDADIVIYHTLAGEPFPVEPADLSRLLHEIPDQAEVTPHANRPHTRHLDVSGAGDLEEASWRDGEKSWVAVPVRRGRDRAVGSEHAMLTQIISLGEGRVSPRVHVRVEDLERGVRLGRYLRCRGASALCRDAHVSRVHALVLDRGGHRWLFDTASTNGTQVVDLDTGVATGPVRGERTFTLLAGQAPSLAGQIALLQVGTPDVPS